MASLADLPEAFAVWLWQTRPFPSAWLRLVDGSTIRVVFAGRHWGGAGPDFRGAVLERSDGTLLRGDVEIHRQERDWQRHHHADDPRYRDVVLHVVLDGNAGPLGIALATLRLGDQIPSGLEELVERFRHQETVPPALACLTSREQAEQLLDSAGLERFWARAAALEGDLACQPVEQVLYRELLAAMGYSANTQTCRRLADVVPYDELASEVLSRRPERRVDAARALLLGRAGLLPEHEVPVPGSLLREWALVDRRTAPRLEASEWRRAGCRPANAPPRRIAGLAGWLAPRLGGDWPRELLEQVRGAALDPRPLGLIESFRARADDDFWPYHADFGRPLPRAEPWLIGRGRAAEIVVNLALPYVYAEGSRLDDDLLQAAALRVFQRLPSGAANRVTIYMLDQVCGGRGWRPRLNTCRQQGLLHLFRQWCEGRWCGDCPAGGRTAEPLATSASRPRGALRGGLAPAPGRVAAVQR